MSANPTNDLIDALGGTASVASFLGVPQNNVSNWRRRGFPGWALLLLAQECEERGIDPGDAFGRSPPRRARTAAPSESPKEAA